MRNPNEYLTLHKGVYPFHDEEGPLYSKWSVLKSQISSVEECHGESFPEGCRSYVGVKNCDYHFGVKETREYVIKQLEEWGWEAGDQGAEIE